MVFMVFCEADWFSPGRMSHTHIWRYCRPSWQAACIELDQKSTEAEENWRSRPVFFLGFLRGWLVVSDQVGMSHGGVPSPRNLGAGIDRQPRAVPPSCKPTMLEAGMLSRFWTWSWPCTSTSTSTLWPPGFSSRPSWRPPVIKLLHQGRISHQHKGNDSSIIGNGWKWWNATYALGIQAYMFGTYLHRHKICHESHEPSSCIIFLGSGKFFKN